MLGMFKVWYNKNNLRQVGFQTLLLLLYRDNVIGYAFEAITFFVEVLNFVIVKYEFLSGYIKRYA